MRRRAGPVARGGMSVLMLALLVGASGCTRRSEPASPGPRQTSASERPAAAAPASAGIAWLGDYQQALAQARKVGKPLMLEVSAGWCSACKRLDEEVFSRADVIAASGQFVPVRVDGEREPELRQRFDVSGYPTIIFLGADGKEVGRVRGAVPYQVMLKEMGEAARPPRRAASAR